MSGFNIKEQQKKAGAEDTGTFVHLHGLDDTPMMYTNKSGEEAPIGITVAGTHSKRYREIEARQRKRRIKPRDLTGSRLAEDSIERLAYCTISWQGFVDDDKNEVPCNFQEARTLYQECPWVIEQIVEAMSDHERFFGSKSTS